jgi:hypothetical protein
MDKTLNQFALMALLGIGRLLVLPLATLSSLRFCVTRHLVPGCLRGCPAGLHATLCDVWFSRIMREVLTAALKTQLRGAALSLVSSALPPHAKTGCVMAVCHSPWFRLLAEWCRENRYALVLSGEDWNHRTRGVNVLGGFRTLRNLVRHLRAGGIAVVVADVFDVTRECPVTFLGEPHLASTLPARLAAAAGVPLATMIPDRQANRIFLHAGPHYIVGNHSSDQQTATRELLDFFEREICLRPALWGRILKSTCSKN